MKKFNAVLNGFGQFLLGAAIAALLLGLGIYIGARSTGLPFHRDTQDMSDTMALIRSQHVGIPVSDDELYYGAIGGMVNALREDPYSQFVDPAEARRIDETMAGTFAGIGVQIVLKNDRPQVLGLMDDSPAAKAGVTAGDIITAVNGASTAGKSLQAITAETRGLKGTAVVLTIQSVGIDGTRDVSIVRDTIAIKSVTWKIVSGSNGKRLMRATITNFHGDTGDLFDRAAEEAVNAKVDGFILDLRDNPGGYIKAAGAVSCTWISRQPYVLMERKDGKREVEKCTGNPRLAGMPTAVLINRYSASASEITAGALQDLANARIIGERSFGKGCGQDITTFSDGAQLRLTAFLWFTPKGHSIDKSGITPDEMVIASPDDIAKDKDTQLESAITFLSEGR